MKIFTKCLTCGQKRQWKAINKVSGIHHALLEWEGEERQDFCREQCKVTTKHHCKAIPTGTLAVDS